MRSKFYAFVINEYFYRRIPFRRFYKRIRAESYTYREYKGTAQSDLEPMIFAGQNEFIKWAEENNYEILWNEKLLIYRGNN